MTRSMPWLEFDTFVLRLAKESDIPAILRYRRENEAFFEPFEPTRAPDQDTEAYWQRQVEADHRQFQADQAVRLILVNPADRGAVLGSVNFTNIVRGPFHSCFLGYALAERAQGRGLMTRSLRLAIDYMFDELNLHRISANYLPHNTRSAAVLKRLGFTVDGYARDYLRIAGRWQDHILTSLVNPDWKEP